VFDVINASFDKTKGSKNEWTNKIKEIKIKIV